MAKKIFNPLEHVSPATTVKSQVSSPVQMKSTSALYNEQVGMCPKCGTSMGTSVIANGDRVYYCNKDRVVQPMLNSF